MVRRSQTSAAGVIALLYEPETVFKQHALRALSPLVPQFWAEISEHIAIMYLLFILLVSPLPDAFIPSQRSPL
jgi:26S proteasome regulatory subunit N2